MPLSDRERLVELQNRVQNDYLITLMAFLPQQPLITRITKEQLLEKLMAHFSTLQIPREVFPFWRYDWHFGQVEGAGFFRVFPSQSVDRVQHLTWQLSAFLPDSTMCTLETMLQNLVEHVAWLQPTRPTDNNYRIQRAIRYDDRVRLVWVPPGQLYEDTLAIFGIALDLRRSARRELRERRRRQENF